MESKKNVLIIVDFQKDFCDKNEGSLYVNGAENALKNILDYINNNEITECILTVDWHTLDDMSFKINRGDWPVHCIQYSEGASINKDILDLLIKKNIQYKVFTKGNFFMHEEYGAFENMTVYPERLELSNYKRDSFIDFYPGTYNYIICGLAGNFCVYHTYKNLMNHGIIPEIFYDGIAFTEEKFDLNEKYNSEKNND